MVWSAGLASVVGWLREGYPDGVPAQDYVPLLALLRRQLTEDEVLEVARTLKRTNASADESGPISSADIGVVITRTTNELASEKDIARVSARLAACGWPLARP